MNDLKKLKKFEGKKLLCCHYSEDDDSYYLFFEGMQAIAVIGPEVMLNGVSTARNILGEKLDIAESVLQLKKLIDCEAPIAVEPVPAIITHEDGSVGTT